MGDVTVIVLVTRCFDAFILFISGQSNRRSLQDAQDNVPKGPPEAPVHDSIHNWVIDNRCFGHEGGNFCFAGRQDAIPSKDANQASKRIR